MAETDNPEDDKVYVFFTERAQEAEGAAGKVLYSRVARVCKVRSLRAGVCLLVLTCVCVYICSIIVAVYVDGDICCNLYRMTSGARGAW